MFKKIKPYLLYILTGGLGLFTFIFSACSGIVFKMTLGGMKWKAKESTYEFMNFASGAGTWNAAGAFEIILIILAVALITFAVLGVLNKTGKLKISLGKLSIDDFLIYITFGFALFSLLQVIMVGCVIADARPYWNGYGEGIRIGAGPLLMFFASVGISIYLALKRWLIKLVKDAIVNSKNKEKKEKSAEPKVEVKAEPKQKKTEVNVEPKQKKTEAKSKKKNTSEEKKVPEIDESIVNIEEAPIDEILGQK